MSIEEIYVKNIYNRIAKQFDSTRYRPWTCVEKFLGDLDNQSLVGDIGCGNGKNMLFEKNDLNFKGCDFSNQLVQLGCAKGLDIVYGNILDIPYPNNYFDNIICIAVLHHISKEEDRIKAINELIRVTKPGGRILILVWAMKQDPDSKIKFGKQDIYLDWKDKHKNILGQRYYHIFMENELESLIPDNVKLNKSFYEKGNFGIIIEKKEYEFSNIDT